MQLRQRAYDQSGKGILSVDLLCGKAAQVGLFSLGEATDRVLELSGQEISYCAWRWCKLGKYQPVHKPSGDYVLHTGLRRFSKRGSQRRLAATRFSSYQNGPVQQRLRNDVDQRLSRL